MRNQEAARYARWAAIAAAFIALSVGGVYGEREIRVARARRNAPPMLPVAVQQQSANFALSGSDALGRTIFTIRASHATQFKEENRALLQDVWITIYGRQGNGDDNIHTRECSYQPVTGNVRCNGEVQIEIERVNAGPGKPADALQVKTSNLSFNKITGEASTPAPVEFEFSEGRGHGVGITYSSNDATVRVEHGIQFEMAASGRTGGLPVSATGSSLTVRRNDRVIVLDGPAVVRQGGRELSAGKISVELDESYHAQRVFVEGRPEMRAAEGKGRFNVAAEKFEGLINAAGWVQRVVADGKVAGTRQTAAGTDRFNAGHAEFAMLPEHNLLKDMTATGGVTGTSHQGTDSRVLNTDALRVIFAAVAGAPSVSAASAGQSAEKQRIETVESLAPAMVQSSSGDEATELNAQRVVAQFGEDGHLGKLLAHSGVELRRQAANDAPQTSSASELAATFGKGGDWDSLDESGNVRFEQAGRRASATHAKISRATDTISLDGGAEFSDSISHTTARSVLINQKSNEIHATGGVVSTYLPTQTAAQGGSAINFGTGSAHISADTVSGSSASGKVVYAGHARLWQQDSVLEADQIEVWRDDKKIQATGHVVAQFPETAGPIDQPLGKKLAANNKAQSALVLWTVRAPSLTYWDQPGKAHLEGGVSASSLEGSLTARSLDVFLSSPGASPGKPPGAAASAISAAGGRQLNRVSAQGSVVVSQGERRGMADQAEYTAADEKFVLSGGQPTLIDNASSDTTTGRSLTFYVANDTILIDSQEGSRTLTKHRIEK